MQQLQMGNGGLVCCIGQLYRRTQQSHFNFRLPMGMVLVSHIEDVVTAIQLSAIAAPATSLTAQQRQLARSIEELWRGRAMEIKLQVELSEFALLVWQSLGQVPIGTTISYSELAARIGKPNSTRAVARVMAQNQFALVLPCHRVVGKNGAMTGFRWGEEMKLALLNFEQKTAA